MTTKKPLRTSQIQDLVLDPNVTKQDMAKLMFDFRDDHPWIGPFIANKKRIAATIGTIIGLSGFTGHKAGEPILEYIQERNGPETQIIQAVPIEGVYAP